LREPIACTLAQQSAALSAGSFRELGKKENTLQRFATMVHLVKPSDFYVRPHKYTGTKK
jgi:hypothetical protein